MARQAFTVTLAACAATMTMSGAAWADGLVDNVNGMTLDKDGKVVRFGAMLVTAEGNVSKLLSGKDKRPDKLDWRVDFKGKTLLPGMIDAHGHVMELGFRALELDLSDTKTLAEAQAKIAAYARANPDRAWIIGGGWNQEVWGLGRFPTAADLDAAVGDRPVWLARADGHASWGNSAALKAAGVTAKSVAPAGGRIEKGAGGQPAGVFVDAAQELVARVVPRPLGKDRNAAFLKAQAILLSYGVTATADMGTSIDDWLTYRRIGDNGGLRLRIMSYGMGVDTTVQIGAVGPSPWLYGDRLKLVGVKLYADGALGSRGAWLKAPYADAPGQSGAGFMSDTVLRNWMSRAAMDGYQVAIHAIGDRANAEALDAIDEMAQTYKGDRRWRIEHAQIVDPADLPRFGRYGTIASMQPVHQTSDRTMAEARLGPQRLVGAYAWASMLKNGAKLAFGSDYPVEKPDPWAGWAAAFTRQDADGQPFGGWHPEQAVTREQAWWAYTGGAAYAGFAEDRIGRLAPGLKADFVVVDRDPLLASPTDLRATKVQETWIGGQKVWERK
ncbi:amidohydrolase family protein [Sphingomonas sp. RP10(2022)]|uniref:Amidohydrolase family protein n=2 Tax=Sphingomonas liriopis TaxID=2949094 RepID=A0A9X2KR71_9SPHN|nr:amidohydrolase family protein [Sphingomonas liriopis]MCP3735700.1 amidohydrolase family protein [Sphingomonas liriopis]